MSFCAWLAWVLYDVREPKDISLRAKQAALRSFLEERRFSLSERSATLRRRSNKRVPTSTLHRVTSPLLLVISRCNAFPYHSPLTAFLSVQCCFFQSFFFLHAFSTPLSLSHRFQNLLYENRTELLFFSLVTVQALLPAWGSNRSAVQAMPTPAQRKHPYLNI